MSESQLVRRPPDPKVRTSSADGHKLISVPKEPPQRQNLRQPRPGTIGAPLMPTPPGVTIKQPTTIQAQVGKPARVVTPARPTPAAQAKAPTITEPPARPSAPAELASSLLAQTATTASNEGAATNDEGARATELAPVGLVLEDGEIALVVQLTRTFAAHAGGEALGTCTSVLAKLEAQIATRDAATEAELAAAPKAE